MGPKGQCPWPLELAQYMFREMAAPPPTTGAMRAGDKGADGGRGADGDGGSGTDGGRGADGAEGADGGRDEEAEEQNNLQSMLDELREQVSKEHDKRATKELQTSYEAIGKERTEAEEPTKAEEQTNRKEPSEDEPKEPLEMKYQTGKPRMTTPPRAPLKKPRMTTPPRAPSLH
jgi:hypothetical protein